MADFKVQFSDGDAFEAKFSGSETPNFKAEMGETQIVMVGAAPYDGEYIVTPDFEGQKLETANKIMGDDVTVKPILVSSVSNHAGGKTIYIGGNIAYG